MMSKVRGNRSRRGPAALLPAAAFVALPSMAGSSAEPLAIGCPSRNDRWAIGTSSAAGGSAFSAHQQLFAMHFGGRAWRRVALANPGGPGRPGPVPDLSFPGNAVYSLTCPSIRQCFAVGSSATAEGGEETLVLEGTSS